MFFLQPLGVLRAWLTCQLLLESRALDMMSEISVLNPQKYVWLASPIQNESLAVEQEGVISG